MLDRLEQLALEVGALQSKLVLLVGPPGSGKTTLLKAFAKRIGALPLIVGSALGRRLASLPLRQRHLQAGDVLRELTDQHANGDLVLIDNIELLFDVTLKLNSLSLLKQYAHGYRIVAVWPGEMNNGRLSYAPLEHPEHVEYAVEGVTTLNIQSNLNNEN